MNIEYSKITLKSDYILDNYNFLGSTIRGVFGIGLKKIVCINPSKICEGCFAKDSCLYYDFFESDFAKFRLSIELGGKLNFDIFLFEEYALKAPYVISAIYKAFREIGVTKKRIKPKFMLYFNDELIYDNEFLSFENKSLIYEINDYKKDVIVFFKTPLRIKENNKFVRDKVKFETILRSINHRYSKLKNQPIEKLPFLPKYEIEFENYSFVELKRFSNRQKSAMKFGGLTGVMSIKNIDEQTYKYLKIGELIGVGKQVTFGLGKIELKE
jgi:CRISPR-associated endoribonuclease Cas6